MGAELGCSCSHGPKSTGAGYWMHIMHRGMHGDASASPLAKMGG